MASYEVRDPIHKSIWFDGYERKVIDRPFSQRLRFVNQLSFLLSYVYPGGVHDRFSHALGAMHVAGRLFARFLASSNALSSRFSGEELEALRRRGRLGGLLHDTGHRPLSLSPEKVVRRLRALPLERSWWKEIPDRQAKHEDYSVLLIQTLVAEGILDAELARDVASLVHAGVTPSPFFDGIERKAPTLHAILKSIVSGEVDCDRMDYLLRDSYYCGVAYGQYDLDWLISSMGVAEQGGKLVFALSENGVRAFEDMLLARYHMIDQVYFHKTKAGFTHCLEQAISSGEITLEIPSDPYAYAELRDGKVIEQLFEAAKDPKNEWSRRLMRREAPKRILRLHPDRFDDRETLEELKRSCQAKGVRWFTHADASALSHFVEWSDSASMMYVAKKTVSGIEF